MLRLLTYRSQHFVSFRSILQHCGAHRNRRGLGATCSTTDTRHRRPSDDSERFPPVINLQLESCLLCFLVCLSIFFLVIESFLVISIFFFLWQLMWIFHIFSILLFLYVSPLYLLFYSNNLHESLPCYLFLVKVAFSFYYLLFLCDKIIKFLLSVYMFWFLSLTLLSIISI